MKNLIEASPETTTVVSVNGIAITGCLDSANAEFLDLQGVVSHACANAMRTNRIPESSLPEQVITVPASVLSLVELQSQGYVYIKPQSAEVATEVISFKKFRLIFRKNYFWRIVNQRL